VWCEQFSLCPSLAATVFKKNRIFFRAIARTIRWTLQVLDATGSQRLNIYAEDLIGITMSTTRSSSSRFTEWTPENTLDFSKVGAVGGIYQENMTATTESDFSLLEYHKR
jgi:hypothetical protein